MYKFVNIHVCIKIRHDVQEVNEIWYPGRGIIKHVGYQLSFTYYTKWPNDERLNVSV